MKLYSLFLIKFIFFFLFTSCAYFDEEEDKILPGKRERVFISDDKILKKANKRVKILPPKTSNFEQQHQNVRNHLYHFKSNPNLKLLKKIKLKFNFKKSSNISPPVFRK